MEDRNPTHLHCSQRSSLNQNRNLSLPNPIHDSRSAANQNMIAA
jgi:hypothetical protein